MKDRNRRRSGRRRAGVDRTVPMRRAQAWAILGLSAAGLIVSSYLTYARYRVQGDPAWESVCATSERFDCTAAILSPHASVAGLPLSILGAWFYILTGLLAAMELWGHRRTWPRSSALVLVLGSSVACLVSLELAAVSAFVLRSWCLFCVSLYVVNFLMLLLAASAFRATTETLSSALVAERERLNRPSFRVVAGTVVALGLPFVVYYIYAKSAHVSVVCDAVALAGREGRDVQLVVYSDYQCPPCKALDASLRQVRARPGLRIALEHYPLDQACNPHARATRHSGACLQALAVVCAEEQSRGQVLSDRLFDDGTKDQVGLIHLAGLLGLDRNRFERCLQSPAAATRLREDIDSAAARDVRATPTLFIDGHRQVGAMSPSDLRCLSSVGDHLSANLLPK